MKGMISRFMDQLEEAIEIGKKAIIIKPNKVFDKIYVAGMGGSGIGGNFVQSFIYNECPIPYLVGKSYEIPQYVDENTLFIVSSYSGNTEETLACLSLAEKKGATIMAISSGGKIIERAKEKSYNYIQVPGNWASPRACLGYSIVQQLYILNKLDFIGDSFEKELEKSIIYLREYSNEMSEEAMKIAETLIDKIPIIYSEDRYEPSAIRLRQQINENAKMLCWHHVIPEMNHNELVGWRTYRPDWAVILFRSNDNLERNSIRMDINKKIVAEYCDTITEINAVGESVIERTMYLVHFGDWISWHLADKTSRDSIEVDVIDYLKSELAKH